MKKPKKAKVTEEKITAIRCSVVCPHCNTYLKGGFDHSVLRLVCYHCGNPIDLIYSELKT